MYRPCVEDLRLPSRDEGASLRTTMKLAGFVVFQHFASAALLGALRAEEARLSDALRDASDGTVIARDAEGRVISLHYLDRHSVLLFDLTRLPGLIELAETILESRCVPFLTEYFAKPAQYAEATPAHQDQIFYRDHFGDELAIAFWIALTDVTVDDGVLEYAYPQPPLGTLLRHRESQVHNFGAELHDDKGFSFRPAPVHAGDAIVHHSYAVHRSGSMSGTGSRSAFALNFRRSPYRQQAAPWTP